MSRYIDADAMRTVKSIQSADFNSIESIQKWIDEQPTADVVEVVRCKDCKHYIKACFEWHDDDDFCSYGERREDEIH